MYPSMIRWVFTALYYLDVVVLIKDVGAGNCQNESILDGSLVADFFSITVDQVLILFTHFALYVFQLPFFQ